MLLLWNEQEFSITGLENQSTAKRYENSANTTFEEIQESENSEDKIANYVLDALGKIPSTEASKTGACKI